MLCSVNGSLSLGYTDATGGGGRGMQLTSFRGLVIGRISRAGGGGECCGFGQFRCPGHCSVRLRGFPEAGIPSEMTLCFGVFEGLLD